MSAQPVERLHDADGEEGEGHRHGEDTLDAPPQVEVRRNAVVSAVLGAAASAIAIAYLWRAAESGFVLDWLLCGVLGLFAAVFLHSLLDARTPLLVADEMGVRIRLGTTWRGLPWDAIERVVVRPRRGFLRDGALVVQLTHVARSIEGLEGRARRHAMVNHKAYGAALAVPLGMATRTDGSDDDLGERIAALSRGRADVVTLISPAPKRQQPDQAPADGSAPGEAAEPAESTETQSDARATVPGPMPAEAPVEGQGEATDEVSGEVSVDDAAAPSVRPRRRWLRRGATPATQESPDTAPEADEDIEDEGPPSDLVEDTAGHAAARVSEEAAPTLPVQRTDQTPSPHQPRAVPLRVQPVDEAVTLRVDEAPRTTRTHDAVNSMREAMNPVGRNDSRVRAIAKLGDPVAPLVIDDFQPEPAYDPVIGPELAASRTRVGLTVDELAERTRIRPHVIESIEVDDFTPCGGDFYARGHIRTLSRVLGKDPVPLLGVYEARYAHAPVNARKVFEAELATGMGGHMPRPYGGPNWTGLVAAVLLLVLVWAGVRLFAGDGGETLEEPPPVLDGAAGLSSYYDEAGAASGARAVPTVLTGAEDGTEVEVRDGGGKLVHEGELAAGQVKRLRVLPPVTVTSDDGGGVSITVAGRDHGLLGEAGSPATQTFEADDE
jgi:cytoskeleton protein RodZ